MSWVTLYNLKDWVEKLLLVVIVEEVDLVFGIGKFGWGGLFSELDIESWDSKDKYMKIFINGCF